LTNRFTPTGGPMSEPRSAHTALLLRDGRVLVAGGAMYVLPATSSIDIYDPVTTKFTAVGSMPVSRCAISAALLLDGRVLITGGWRISPPTDQTLGDAYLFDPSTGETKKLPDMNVARAWHASTVLPNGKVLITGGGRIDKPAEPSAEIFDPATLTFALAPAMKKPRMGHTATLMPDGRVMLIGGGAGTVPEMYEPPR
jgi:hypothetical protein